MLKFNVFRKLFVMLCTFLILFCVSPAIAATVTLYTGGVATPIAAGSGVYGGGAWDWDGVDVLTLTGPMNASRIHIGLALSESITIEIEGAVSFDASGAPGEHAFHIESVGGGSATIIGAAPASLSLKAKVATPSGPAAGLYSEVPLFLNVANLIADVTSDGSAQSGAIYSEKGVTITGVSVTVTASREATLSYLVGIGAETGGVTISGSTVNIATTGIAAYGIFANNGGVAITNGSNVKLTANSPAVGIITNNGGNVSISDGSSVTASDGPGGGSGINANGNISISGAGTTIVAKGIETGYALHSDGGSINVGAGTDVSLWADDSDHWHNVALTGAGAANVKKYINGAGGGGGGCDAGFGSFALLALGMIFLKKQ